MKWRKQNTKYYKAAHESKICTSSGGTNLLFEGRSTTENNKGGHETINQGVYQGGERTLRGLEEEERQRWRQLWRVRGSGHSARRKR
jgi:hypothetical protein